MRILGIATCTAVLLATGFGDLAQTQAQTQNDIQTSSSDSLRIEWQVKNRFRLFRNEADFQRHVAADRGDGVLAAEDRLESKGDGRGWAKDVVDHLCIDGAGKLPETCDRDGERENYLAPKDHRVGMTLAGSVPADATCTWNFDDGTIPPQQATVKCGEEVRLRLRYGKPTIASVGITAPDGSIQQAAAEIQVRDFLIAGLGDSIAAGEGNPDKPIVLADTGFCFRGFTVGPGSEYFRPGRAGYQGDSTCGTSASDAGSAKGTATEDWQRHGARWLSAPCHRSLYSYQMRTALALAVENPHLAVTFIPLACSGAAIDAGLLNPQRIRECAAAGRASCAATTPGQLGQLQELLARAHRQQPDRGLDLMLLTVGANDIKFSGLTAHVIIEEGTERSLFNQAGLLTSAEEAGKILDTQVPTAFAKLRAALKPLVGENLGKIVYVSYGNPALAAEGTPCPGGRDGFDVHPAFSADPERLQSVADFVSRQFLPKIKAVATCQSGKCRDTSERMTFVDAHQAAFAAHGFCARADDDPSFDRKCFSPTGESFESSLVTAMNDPLVCELKAGNFRPYAPRARWIRTANDSYFTAMTYPTGLPSVMQPADIHDALWGVLSAVYGGVIHPTAEGHAAMADAALPAARKVLGLAEAAAVAAEPLPPPESPPADR
jgi:hypothetical protein